MFVMMCGIPKAGKSLVADTIFGDLNIIRPSDWVIKNMPEEEAEKFKIAAAEQAFELVKDELADLDDEQYVILDQCNLSCLQAIPTVQVAKDFHHRTVVIYVHAKQADCVSRWKQLENIDCESVISDYLSKIKFAVKSYQAACDTVIPISNVGTVAEVVASAKTLRQKLRVS